MLTAANRDRLHTLLADRDFVPYPYRVFLLRGTGDVVCFYSNDEDAETEGQSAEDNKAARLGFENAPDAFVEIPLPTHGERHEWFRNFLTSLGRADEKPESIGLWLKRHARDHDRWHEYERARIDERIDAAVRESGIE